jgi:hypothetical protein
MPSPTHPDGVRRPMAHMPHMQRRLELLQSRMVTLNPSITRARQSVKRLEMEQVPAGAIAGARAVRLSAARAMVTTLEERERQVRIALSALQAELGPEVD